MVTPSFKIGVDGGGTKTECILIDAHGEVLARHLAPGCNPSQTGPEKARAILEAALRELTAKNPGPISHSLFCMAGNRTFWRETADALSDFGPITTTDDSVPVLALATAGAPGLVLHAGTGSFVAARAPDGTLHYAGGLGWKIGDPGSGFDLGRRAIAVALLELQERPADLSPLANALCAHTGLEDYAANSRFFYNYHAANAAIAGFAPRVLELAQQDNASARQVLADSLGGLVQLTDRVIRRLFPAPAAKVPCGVSGRILNSEPAATLLSSLAGRMDWPVELRFIDTAPIEGVRRLLEKM